MTYYTKAYVNILERLESDNTAIEQLRLSQNLVYTTVPYNHAWPTIVQTRYDIKDPPPLDFCTVIIHEIILSKSTIPTGSISDKKD